MLKLSFCLALLIICFCINYLFGASNQSKSEEERLKNSALFQVTALKNLWAMLTLMVKLTECSVIYGIDRMLFCSPSIGYYLEMTQKSLIVKSQQLSEKEKEKILRANCSPDMKEQFEEINKIIKSCVKKMLKTEAAVTLKDRMLDFLTKIYRQMAYFGFSSLLPNHTDEDALHLFQELSSASGFTVTKLVLATTSKTSNENNTQKEDNHRKRRRNDQNSVSKQLSQQELLKATKAADLSGHLILGCCTDGTCGALEGKAKPKTKSKKKGGGKKKPKDIALDAPSLEKKFDEIDNEILDQNLVQSIEIVNQIIHFLGLIAEIEEKLISGEKNFQTIMTKISEIDSVIVNKGLKERLAKLPVNMKTQSGSTKNLSALKHGNNKIIREMARCLINSNGGGPTVHLPCDQKANGKCAHCTHCSSKLSEDDEIYSVD
ncbi:Signal peptide region containing protein [Cryptosporidium tyzzeri]|nr:Signal peptide region containing protein [Cryptosporidium tyzzeri]